MVATIGIVSYGGYIPRLRLDRMSIYQQMGWFAPATVMVAQGERSFCNWDEDSLTMAVAAARDCLAGTDKAKVDGVYLCSTTLPFGDRQNAGVLKSTLNLRDDIHTNDFTSALKAGTSGLVAALSAVKSGDNHRMLVTATDNRQTKAAYFYEMWFGDGAGSLLVGDDNVIAEFKGSYSVSYDFVDHYRGAKNAYDYVWEERWARDEGYGKIIPEAMGGLLSKLGLSIGDVTKVVFPCIFQAEHRNIARKLGARPEQVPDNMHEVCGEAGAAHPLLLLVRELETAKPGDRILVVGFGQGADALLFEATDRIAELAPRVGVAGSLANKKVVRTYPKFLKFRDLIKTEMGIRGEAPTQTAMTVLWRRKKMLFGLVGGKCPACGTPQFPKAEICVNPACKATAKQEDFEYLDEPAKVMSYTADLLAVSVDPPQMYGMVAFDAGGRFMADFTDCDFEEVFVGQSVKFAYRKRYTDAERGFTGYFWKAIPQPAAEAEKAAAVGSGIRFDGQVAIVTGAGAGLGRTYALDLARRGAKVVVNDLGGARDGSGGGSARPADEVVKEIVALGGEAVANYDSVATADGGAGIVRSALDAFGRVDILINNAGILRDRSLAKMSQAEWDAVLSVHLEGAYHVTKAAFPHMRESEYGRIVMTTSAAGMFGNFGQTNYGAAKMGLLGFMNTLELEGGRYNVYVNALAPVAATRLTQDVLPPDLYEKLQPEFVSPLVLYLCSRECSASGRIFNAGMGYFSRTAMVAGPGTAIGDGQRVPTPEDVLAHWEAIESLANAREYDDAMGALTPMMEAFTRKPGADRDDDEADGGPKVADIFARMVDAFQADAASGVDVVFQYDIAGKGGGDWHSIIKDGGCEVLEGQHASPTTTIRMKDEDFLAMMTGSLNAMAAYTSGRLKIEGDLMKSQLIEKLFRF